MSDPTLHTRRRFLRTGLLGGAAAWTLPVFLEKTFFALDAMAADSPIQTPTGKDASILVVLQMAGGNDGLNMVIPYADDHYYSLRPQIGIRQDKVQRLTDLIGLHPRLTGLRSLYDAGNLALLQGVGYPNPNRSHFRSTDIWQTATDSNKYETTGWLGRYFDSCCKGEDPTVGVAIGAQAPMSFNDRGGAGITLAQPEQFKFQSSDAATGNAFREMNNDEAEDMSGASVQSLPGRTQQADGDALDFVRRTALDAQVSSDQIIAVSKKTVSSAVYPSTKLASDLHLVARLIAGGMPTRVYYVSQGGYDTHANQLATHERLYGELDGALNAFVADLKAQGNFNRVTLMTFSEFGRRVAENNGGGTDHGAAAPMFVLGGGVKPGVFGRQPALDQLQDGDLVYNVDFRNVYATMLDKWLKAPSEVVLKRKFDPMAFI